jgi:hypothetical protein
VPWSRELRDRHTDYFTQFLSEGGPTNLLGFVPLRGLVCSRPTWVSIIIPDACGHELALATWSILFVVMTTSSYPCIRDPADHRIIEIIKSQCVQVGVQDALQRVCRSQRKKTVSWGTSFAILGMDGDSGTAKAGPSEDKE